MMFCPGDLVRVPSNVELFKIGNMDMVNNFKVTNKPEFGIFIKYKNDKNCIINTGGEDWVVSLEFIRIMEKKDGKISSNF